MEMLNLLPEEISNKIWLYLRHPCVDMLNEAKKTCRWNLEWCNNSGLLVGLLYDSDGNPQPKILRSFPEYYFRNRTHPPSEYESDEESDDDYETDDEDID